MNNKGLTIDYLNRSRARLKAVAVLVKEKSYADVVRESQEIVELCSKALLRANGIEPPRIHDVSQIIKDNENVFKNIKTNDLKTLCKISHTLRRDRELAYYGSEDLTPSDFYSVEDANEAYEGASWVYKTVNAAICDLI
ncbi:MAG: HEPN domain-containing protein [Bdellovibrionales bacterium]|nr:HEPN domain-containing protein [Bdellovibrionales bacterium]